MGTAQDPLLVERGYGGGRWMRASSYERLAQHYDGLFGQKSPLAVARQRVLGATVPRVASACDLACGTGTLAVEMARAGVRTYALDRSTAMCRAARRKAKAARARVRVIRADMRSFRLPERVELVTCEGDAVNHLERRSDLARLARAAARALVPGGRLFFDVNNAAGFERYWRGNVWVERPGLVLVMRNGHDLRALRAWSDIEIFVRHGRAWQRGTERVEEVCWHAREIRATLLANGFDRVQAWDASPFFAATYGRDNVVAPGCRTVYLARAGRVRAPSGSP